MPENLLDSPAVMAELLPKRLQEFVRLIGLAATLKVVERYGGTRLYVPANPHSDHPLAVLIGLDQLTKLSAVYAGEDHFDIPRAVRALRHVRDVQMRADYKVKSAAVLAREHGLTERQVFNIVGAEGDPGQDGLFD